MGVLFSAIAGILVSLQSVFNTRVSDKIGLWETNTMVHFIGFIFCLIIMLGFGNVGYEKLGEVNKLYFLGGVFGGLIVYSVMAGISLLGTTLSTSILLVVQLIIATIIDTFGLFESPKIEFHFTKPLGVLIMIIGIIVFKLKG
ncbi:MAG: DMT family transporter [Clostridiaceae bacterium]|nr:DMT family transporter [Clostridiaceae bacterium]MBW4859403.1 DMT family transporter [Clostridiaceae bacterium]MBW4867249.1 DMT family transporter [Clostridiaceae bacterium]